MTTLNVFCSYHQQYGTCTEEDYNDAKDGRNPSNMVRVGFKTFHHAVPFHTLTVVEPDKVLPPHIVAMAEKEKQARIKEIDKEIGDIRSLKKQNRVTYEDIEDVSDNYQYNLEWNALLDELADERTMLVQSLTELDKPAPKKHLRITVWSAETTFPNTAESDKLPQVFHTVRYGREDMDDTQLAYIMAIDPTDAMKKARLMNIETITEHNRKPIKQYIN